MKLEILKIGESANTENGKLNISGISDIFYSKTEPTQIAKCFVVFRVRYDPSETGLHKIKLSIVNQDGKLLGPPLVDEKNIQLPEDSPGCVDTGIVCLNGLPLPKFGEYIIEFAVDDVSRASQPLYLLRAQ